MSRASAKALMLAAAALAAPVSLAHAQDGSATSAAGKPYFEMPLLYATSRVAQNVAGPRETYGSGLADAVSYGTAVVTIPMAHIAGMVEMPPISILERRLKMPRRPRDLGKSFSLLSVTPQPAAPFWEIAPKAGPAADGNLLLYLPARTLSFNDALFRAAQFSFDIRLPSPTLVFSWPSTGSTVGYLRDTELSARSEAAMRDVLRDLGTSSAKWVDIVASGLGSRMLLRAIVRAGESGSPLSQKLRNVVLYAPDVDIDEFRVLRAALAKLYTPQPRVTLYADPTSLDVAVATQLFGTTRVGAMGPGQVDVPGIDFVAVENGDLKLNHSDSGNAVLRDLSRLLTAGQAPDQRGLMRERSLNERGDASWRLQ